MGSRSAAGSRCLRTRGIQRVARVPVKQTRAGLQTIAARGYFGLTDGSPPGLPGGGITGVLPLGRVGARISGSTPAGGHSTPSDLASLSPSEEATCPVVV